MCWPLIPIARCSFIVWLIMIGPNLLGPGVCCLLFFHPFQLITNWCFHLQQKLNHKCGQVSKSLLFNFQEVHERKHSNINRFIFLDCIYAASVFAEKKQHGIVRTLEINDKNKWLQLISVHVISEHYVFTEIRRRCDMILVCKWKHCRLKWMDLLQNTAYQ